MDFPQGFSLDFYPNKEKCETSIVGKAKLEKMNFINDVQIGENTTYQEVINIDDRSFIAPDVGIIRYVSYNNVDTFYLEKYEIK